MLRESLDKGDGKIVFFKAPKNSIVELIIEVIIPGCKSVWPVFSEFRIFNLILGNYMSNIITFNIEIENGSIDLRVKKCM